MDMKHDEVVRIIPGARTAVLLIHGICGTPNHFVGGIPLIEWIPSDWSIYNLLLPGHGGTVEDFAKSSLKQWRCSVRRAFCALAKTHEQVLRFDRHNFFLSYFVCLLTYAKKKTIMPLFWYFTAMVLTESKF